MLGKIVAVTNQKGGVGKTTTAVNLAAALGAAGQKILLVDVDPQGNSTSGYGINKKKLKSSVYDILIGNADIDDVILHTEYMVDVIPSNMNLAGAEIEIVSIEDRESRLKKSLIGISPEYDFVFIDCPPSFGLLTLNALCAADTILVPTQCEYYALEGMSQLVNSVRQVRRMYNSALDIEGVLFTMYDGRLNLTIQVADEIKRHFPGKVYASVIPRNVRLSEAPSHGKPVQFYDRYSRGAESYNLLAREMIGV